MIFAILRAQLLSMQSFRLGSRRRGAVFSIITGLVWYGFWAMVALGAYAFTANTDDLPRLQTGSLAGLLFIFSYWQIAPVVSASMGASLDYRKLLVYPIPRNRLFVIELLLRLTNALEMLMLLAGGALGLAMNPVHGRTVAAVSRIAAAVLLAIVWNVLASAGLRNLLERWLAKKRLREALIFLLVLAVTLPRLLIVMDVPMAPVRGFFLSEAQQFWPWAAAARVALGTATAVGAQTLCVWIALTLVFARRQFERNLRFDIAAATASTLPEQRRRAPLETLYRIPGLLLRDPVGALVEKEIRSLARTPRFRMVFFMGFSFGLLVWLPLVMGPQRESVMADNFLVVVAVYALTLLGQVTFWNTFGFDRAAVQLYFAAPVPVGAALAAKNLAAGVFILLELAMVTAVCLLLRVTVPPMRIAEAFLVTPIASLYMLAVGNLSSVHFPKPMTPERVSQGGASSRFQALIFVFYPLALLPVFLAYMARYTFDSEPVFYALLAFAAVLGAVVYWIAMESAVGAAHRRREILIAELTRSEGPLVSD